MPTYYVTFGYGHKHVIDGQTFDKDLVGTIFAEDYAEAQGRCFAAFGSRFCFLQEEEPDMRFFYRGFHPVNMDRVESVESVWNGMTEDQKRICQLSGVSGKWSFLTRKSREVIRDAVIAGAENCNSPHNYYLADGLRALARAMTKEIEYVTWKK